jgi:hypothetical protein
MQVVDANGNVFGQGLEITSIDGKPKVPVINTDITIGTTVINGGVSGRLLFDDAGVVGETNGIHWNTAGFLGIGTIIPVAPTGYNGITINSTTGAYTWFQTGGVTKYSIGTEGNINYHNLVAGTSFLIRSGGNNYFNLVQSTGNVQIGTTTDAGYKLDVAGTARISSSLWTDVISPVGSSLYIYSAGLSGGGYNRLNIYYNSVNGFVMQSDGGAGGSRSMSIFGGGPGGVLNLGTNGTTRWTFTSSYDALGPGHIIPAITNTYDIGSTTNTARAIYSNIGRFSGTVTAATNLAQGISVSNVLTASANNDVLIGLDVVPTFTNGAFTGVTNIAARLRGHLAFGAGGDRYIYQQSPATSGSGSNLIIQSASANTSGQGGNIYIYPGSGAGGPGPGKTFIGNQNGWDGIYMTGLVTIGNGGPNTGSALQVNAGGQNGLNIYWDNLTPFMQYGLVSGRQSRFVNSSSYSFSTNLIIGGTTNAGYMLDVNGIGRMQTSSAGIPNILHISNLQTDAGPGGAIAFYTGNVVGNASRIVAQRSGSVGQSDIAFETNGVRRLFVSANDGNVGIGTTSPFGKFDVRDGDIFATISSNANLRSRLTYQGLYVSRAVDGAYPENIISHSSAWLYNSRNAHSFFRDTILLLSIGALQGTAGININTNGNVLINTSTDAGFKLDVNGTTRVQGVITGSVSAGGLTLGAASANQVGIALNGYFVSSGAISTSNFNARSFNHIIGGQGAGIVSTFNGLAQGLTTNCEYFVARGNINLTDGAIDLSGYSFAPTIVSEVGATIKAFSSSLSAASNRWNLFLSGTAKNYIAGNVLIGTTTDTGYKLNVNGGGYFESNLKVNGAITATVPTANTYVCNIGLAADQSIASGSDAQIDFVDIDDINNWYNPTTKRFTPTIAGYYHVDFTVWFDPATVTTAQYNVQIRKNASTVLIIQQPTINNGTGQSLTGSKLIYFNGTTDYIDFTAYQSTGVNRTLQTGASSSGTYASIFLLAI